MNEEIKAWVETQTPEQLKAICHNLLDYLIGIGDVFENEGEFMWFTEEPLTQSITQLP